MKQTDPKKAKEAIHSIVSAFISLKASKGKLDKFNDSKKPSVWDSYDVDEFDKYNDHVNEADGWDLLKQDARTAHLAMAKQFTDIVRDASQLLPYGIWFTSGEYHVALIIGPSHSASAIVLEGDTDLLQPNQEILKEFERKWL